MIHDIVWLAVLDKLRQRLLRGCDDKVVRGAGQGMAEAVSGRLTLVSWQAGATSRRQDELLRQRDAHH